MKQAHWLRRWAERIRMYLAQPVLNEITAKLEREMHTLTGIKGFQLLLALEYDRILQAGCQPPGIRDVGFRVFSESDEDGILHFIFSMIGPGSRHLVDIGAGSIEGSNTANLLTNHGWTGVLIDGNPKNVKTIQDFYAQHPDTRLFPPTAVCTWITAENINTILIENGCCGEIDLLCIDVDGVDWWIWKALDAVSPRVVLVEYQCVWGPEKSVTVPYSADFKGGFAGRFGVYSGASLAAFVKLGKEKGYRLVGSQRYGYNAFFLRNDVGKDVFPEIAPSTCFEHPFARWAHQTLLPQVKDSAWIEV